MSALRGRALDSSLRCLLRTRTRTMSGWLFSRESLCRPGLRPVGHSPPPMAHHNTPDCVLCGEPIKTSENKMTIDETPYHMDCWERASMRNGRAPHD
jgi:hypothetical protein